MITLWGRNNSTNVKKVLLTLEELELPYEQILAGREFGINHDADFLAMNPNGLVPLLRDDESDLILWESNAIVRYLAAQYGQKRLWIDSPARRAEAEKWMDWANQTLSNAHRGILMGLVRTPPEERDQAAIGCQLQRVRRPVCPARCGTGKSKMVLWRRVWCGRYRYRTVHLQFV